jgi:hypothetical protein
MAHSAIASILAACPRPAREEKMRITLSAFVAVAMLLALAGGADAETTANCTGHTVLNVITNYQTATRGGETLVSFDYSEAHDFCLRDGSKVVATETGSVLERISANGDLHLRSAREVLTYAGSSITFTANASLTPSGWNSAITSVGRGTGMFDGLNVHGRFFPTADPAVFTFDLTLIWH